MSKNPGPVRRGTRWYIRVRVPDDLVDTIGKREIWKSLGTGDHRKAKALYPKERAKVERQFATARDGLATLADEDMQRMVIRWFDQHDRQAAEADFGTWGGEHRDAREAAEEWEAILVDGAEEEATTFVCARLDAMLAANGWPMKPHQVGPIRAVTIRVACCDKDSAQYGTLVGYFRRAMVEAARRRRARLRGDPAGQVYDPMFAGVGAGASLPTNGVAVRQAAKAPPLTKIFAKWKAERKPSTKTAHEWDTAVRRFTQVCGDMPVDAITTAHVRDFKEALLQLPSVMAHSMRGKTVPQVITATRSKDLPKLAAGTVNKQLTAIRALLSWCRKNGYVETNVAAQLSVPTARNNADKRLPYSVEDMGLLFKGMAKYRKREPSKLFLPLLAAFTGARLEELGQLRVGDVRHRDGIDYVDINVDDEGKSLKTRGARREVPVHPELVHCGFLEHVERCRASGGGLLFPELKPDPHGVLTGNFSKWWGHHRRKRGVRDRRKVFHSFRHGFKEACRAAGVGEEVHDALTGHTGGGVGRTYGGVPLDLKAKEIVKVKYEGLELFHLRMSSAQQTKNDR
jgi:integrase